VVRYRLQKFIQIVPEVKATIENRVGMRVADRLKTIPFFAGIKENKPWSKLGLLGTLFQFEEFSDQQIICKEGENADKFYIIVDGKVSVFVTRRNESIAITQLPAGAWFGEIALLRNTPRTASVMCVGDCSLLSITSAKFQKFLKLAPELSQTFETYVIHRTAEFLKKVPLFKNIKENKPWNKMDLLASLFMYRALEKGKVVFSIGEKGDLFYVLTRGPLPLLSLLSLSLSLSSLTTARQGLFQ
jgi:CRP-like cAMP-binding protein